MTRNTFGGYGGGGGGRSPFDKGGKGESGRRGIAADNLLSKLSGLKGFGGAAASKNKSKRAEYMNMMKDKADAKKLAEDGRSEDNRYKQEDVEKLSAAAKFMFDKMMAKKMAKREAAKNKVKVMPMNVRNGRVDGGGIIYTPGGRKAGYIDLKTGEICNNMGFRMGKYNPKTPMFSVVDIERLLENFRGRSGGVTIKPLVPDNPNPDKPFGGFW